jgi:hypothetical protein
MPVSVRLILTSEIKSRKELKFRDFDCREIYKLTPGSDVQGRLTYDIDP